MGNSIPSISVFEKCLGLLNLQNFRCPFSDTYAKKLLFGTTVLLFVDAQVRGHESLSDIELNLRANPSLQNYTGLAEIHASSLYRKLEQLPRESLQALCIHVLKQLRHLHKGKKGIPDLGRLNIIDSTEISLPKQAGEWAYCSKDKNGVKMHLRLVVADRETMHPDGVVLSTSAVSDQEGALPLVVDDNAVYVFDRGYFNYHLYHQWLRKNIWFVARVRSNSNLPILYEYHVEDEDSHLVTRDALVEVKDPKTKETYQLRLVEYTDDNNRNYRVITNLREHTAGQIAEIYKNRWFIEIFFKWIKSHLKIKKLFNHKPEAVWNQIYIALIAYGVSELIKEEVQTEKSVWSVLKTMRHYWFLEWQAFTQELNRKPKHPSKGRKRKRKPGRKRIHERKLTAKQIIIS